MAPNRPGRQRSLLDLLPSFIPPSLLAPSSSFGFSGVCFPDPIITGVLPSHVLSFLTATILSILRILTAHILHLRPSLV